MSKMITLTWHRGLRLAFVADCRLQLKGRSVCQSCILLRMEGLTAWSLATGGTVHVRNEDSLKVPLRCPKSALVKWMESGVFQK